MVKKKGDTRIEVRAPYVGVLLLLFAGWLLILAQVFATPSGPTITYISNETSTAVGVGTLTDLPGGYIAIANLFAIQQNIHWKGFVGNITGEYALADAAGAALYSWAVGTFSGEVYATRVNNVYWALLECANQTHVEDEELYFNHTFENTEFDGINVTFFEPGNHSAFTVADTTFNFDQCNWSIWTYVNATAQTDTTFFEEILLYDNNTDNLVYVTLMENDAYGFQNNSGTFDYQIILPENATPGLAATSTPYYFFVELL